MVWFEPGSSGIGKLEATTVTVPRLLPQQLFPDQSTALLEDKVDGDRESALPQAPFFRSVNRSKSFRTPRQRCSSGSVRQSLASFSSGAGLKPVLLAFNSVQVFYILLSFFCSVPTTYYAHYSDGDDVTKYQCDQMLE